MAGMVNIEVFFLFFIHAVASLTLAPDSNNVQTGETVKLVCDVTIPAFTATVTLSKDNVLKTSCDNANICTPYSSDSGRYQYSSNSSAVTVEISSIQASDEGTWTCRVGTSQPVYYSFKISSTGSPDNEDCTGTFHCGFWLLMLVVASSVIICILIKLKVEIFGGFCTVKIVIIVIFSVVAIGIGLGLGLGLRKGGGNCLDCGATIGISISLGVALSVIQFIVIIKCDKGKGCDGNSEGETSDRSNGDRARTPASATGINLETKKKSQNKPTEKSTEASSLTSKSFGHPLPETPNTRKNQLEPLKTDSFEVENPSTERKKKKKRKKKKETSEGNEASEEKEERPELEF